MEQSGDARHKVRPSSTPSVRTNRSGTSPVSRGIATGSSGKTSGTHLSAVSTAVDSTADSLLSNSSHPDKVMLSRLEKSLGLQPGESESFGWIAEIAMSAELPPGWTSRTDEASGIIRYVNKDTLTSSSENPLIPYLKDVVKVGRQYLENPYEGFFKRQRKYLWQLHKKELESWYGPIEDGEGNSYYVHLKSGISSWQDPRQAKAYIYDLQCLLLGHLQTMLASEDPGFFDDGLPWEDEDCANFLKLDVVMHRRKPAKSSPSNSPAHRRKPAKSSSLIRVGQEDSSFALQQMQRRMNTTAEWVHDTVQSDEQAQRDRMLQRVEERRRRSMSRAISNLLIDAQTPNNRSMETRAAEHVPPVLNSPPANSVQTYKSRKRPGYKLSL